MLQKFKMTTFAAVLGLFGFVLFSAAPVFADHSVWHQFQQCDDRPDVNSRINCFRDHAKSLIDGIQSGPSTVSTVCHQRRQATADFFFPPPFDAKIEGRNIKACTIGAKRKWKIPLAKVVYEAHTIGKTLNPRARLEGCDTRQVGGEMLEGETKIECLKDVTIHMMRVCHAPMDESHPDRFMQKVDVIEASIRLKINFKGIKEKTVVAHTINPCLWYDDYDPGASLPPGDLLQSWIPHY